MGFADEKRWLLEVMREGTIVHQYRPVADEKNWLAQGWLGLTEAQRLVEATRGDQAQERALHGQSQLTVWIFAPRVEGLRWYIKFHRVGPRRVKFLSFHPSESES